MNIRRRMGLLYEKVTVTTNVACTIYIGSNGSSSDVKSFTTYIPYGTTYTVRVYGYSNDYYDPDVQTFTAGLNSRSVTITFTEKVVYTGIYFDNITNYNVDITITFVASNGWPMSESVTVPSNTSNYFYDLNRYIDASRMTEIRTSGYALTITSGLGENFDYNCISIYGDYLHINEGDTFYITIDN